MKSERSLGDLFCQASGKHEHALTGQSQGQQAAKARVTAGDEHRAGGQTGHGDEFLKRAGIRGSWNGLRACLPRENGICSRVLVQEGRVRVGVTSGRRGKRKRKGRGIWMMMMMEDDRGWGRRGGRR